MITMYSDLRTKETKLEVWGSSTKHPDSVFYFSDFEKSEFVEDEDQLFQWVLECASKMLFPISAVEMTVWAYQRLLDPEVQAYSYKRYFKELPVYPMMEV